MTLEVSRTHGDTFEKLATFLFPPKLQAQVPAVGDLVVVHGRPYSVLSREFLFSHPNGEFGTEQTIRLWVE